MLEMLNRLSIFIIINECSELRRKFNAACEAYKKRNDEDNSCGRSRRVVEALGLDRIGPGNRQSRDHRAAYEKYVRLVRNEGWKREDTLKNVQGEFGYNSIDSARNSLYKELKKVKEWWKKQKDLEKYWKGLIPSKKL